MNIVYASYGANKRKDVSNQVHDAYNQGKRVFEASNSSWGDPDVGANKSLFITWVDDSGQSNAAAATEPHIGNVHTIELP